MRCDLMNTIFKLNTSKSCIKLWSEIVINLFKTHIFSKKKTRIAFKYVRFFIP